MRIKNLFIALLICLLPVSTFAGDFPEMEEELSQTPDPMATVSFKDDSYTGWNWITLTAMVIGNTADAWTTDRGINQLGTCKEVGIPAKFIIGEYPSTGAIIAFKAAAVGLIVALVEWPDWEDKQTVRNVMYGTTAVLTGFIAIKNYGECSP